MAYVPGFTNDLFISYAHGDNEGRWVSGFHERLRIKLRELLPVSPVIWRDERLGPEADFPAEIRRQIGSTAVVLVVVSPAYLASPYCRLERLAFNEAVASQGGLNVGTSLRIVKVIKTPKENHEHHSFLKEALGFEFFRFAGDQDFDEFIPGQREFDGEVDRLARRLRDLLRAMRNQRQAIFVAEKVPNELEPVWESVRNELSANGYRVVPTDRLDPDFFDPQVLRAELEPAILSVHLFAGKYDKFSADQARLARSLGKQAVIWVSPDSSLDDAQRDFLSKHAGYSDGEIRYSFLTTCREWQLPRAILDQLKPTRELSDKKANGAASIYLICDRTDPVETACALRLRESIMETEKMQVLLPGMDKDPALLDEEHWSSLSVCDGVLLYWGHTGKEWFQENSGDVRRASRRLRRARPFRSEAILLTDPDSPDKAVVEGNLVIREFNGCPSLDRLEPFLGPLRNGFAR